MMPSFPAITQTTQSLSQHIPDLQELSTQALVNLDLDGIPTSPQFYEGLKVVENGPNYLHDLAVQSVILSYLEKLEPQELAVLPLFGDACEEYTQLVTVCIKGVLMLDDASVKGKVFVNLIKSSQNESLQEVIRANLKEIIQAFNEIETFNNMFLSNLNLSGLDLSHLNLKGATLVDAKMNGTVLYHTNLTDSDLRYADLSYSRMDYACLHNVKIDNTTKMYGVDMSKVHINLASSL